MPAEANRSNVSSQGSQGLIVVPGSEGWQGLHACVDNFVEGGIFRLAIEDCEGAFPGLDAVFAFVMVLADIGKHI